MSLLLTSNVPSPASWANPRDPSYFRGSKSFPLTFIYVTIKHLVYRDMLVFALEAMSYLYKRSVLLSPSSICGIRDSIIMGRCNFWDAGPRPSKMNLRGSPKRLFPIEIYRATKEKQGSIQLRMRHIKPYQELFEDHGGATALTQKQISWLNECSSTEGLIGSARLWKLNPQTGLVDVDGSFNCGGEGLTDFKGVRFGVVKRDFFCDENQLTSLEGAPQSVGGSFHCNLNQLTNLAGAPQRVGGGFYCSTNGLTSLVGAPETVNGNFWCSRNSLTSLEGAPQEVGGDFICDDNSLTSLGGAPQRVGGYFKCDSNSLTSLEGAPRTIKRNFSCNINQLTSLRGAPQTVDGDFDCEYNPVSESALKAIFGLMKGGKTYQQALERYWPKMSYEDKSLMYKNHSSLTPEEVREYKALATYNNIKGYL